MLYVKQQTLIIYNISSAKYREYHGNIIYLQKKNCKAFNRVIVKSKLASLLWNNLKVRSKSFFRLERNTCTTTDRENLKDLGFNAPLPCLSHSGKWVYNTTGLSITTKDARGRSIKVAEFCSEFLFNKPF